MQDAQKGCPARPQRATRRTLRYVEPLSDARTTLADFFSILVDGLCCQPTRSGLSRFIGLIERALISL